MNFDKFIASDVSTVKALSQGENKFISRAFWLQRLFSFALCFLLFVVLLEKPHFLRFLRWEYPPNISTVEQRINLKFLAKLDKTPSECFVLLQQVYKEETMSRARAFEWHKRFREGREECEDDQRSDKQDWQQHRSCETTGACRSSTDCKAAFTRATFLRAIFWYKWMWQSCIYSIMVLIVIKVTLLLKMTVSSCFHSDSDILHLFKAKSELISLRFFIAAPILF